MICITLISLTFWILYRKSLLNSILDVNQMTGSIHFHMVMVAHAPNECD